MFVRSCIDALPFLSFIPLLLPFFPCDNTLPSPEAEEPLRRLVEEKPSYSIVVHEIPSSLFLPCLSPHFSFAANYFPFEEMMVIWISSGMTDSCRRASLG